MSSKVPALEKGLQVIEVLLSSDEPLSMSLIADALGHKVCEIQRMIEYLAGEKYIVRGVSGSYTPGPKAYALSDRSRDSTLVSRAEGPMRRYALKYGASVHLGVLVEKMLHVVYGIDGGGMVRVSVRPGLYEADKNISGQLLLAYRFPDSENTLAAESPHLLRERGWNWGEISCTRGVYIVATPIATSSNPCAAILASPYLSPELICNTPRLDLIEGLSLASSEISALC